MTRQNLDEAPAFEKMREGYERRRSYRRRASYGKLWNKMKATLKAHVGQVWEDVWAKISSENDYRVFTEDVFREEFREKVKFDVYVDDNGDFQSVNWVNMVWSQWSDTFYVEKGTRILKYIPKTKKRRYVPRESNIVSMNNFEYYKHDGLWYEVQTVSLTAFDRHWKYYWGGGDAFGTSPYERYQTYNEDVMVIRKRQVGKKVIRKINDQLESRYYD